jgi:vancomycin permeability regulator SanA
VIPRLLRRLALLVLAATLLLFAPSIWLRATSAGHVHKTGEQAQAPVAIVYGAQVAPDGAQPDAVLRGRLDVAVDLVLAGRAKAVLVSGDARDRAGDQVAVMSRYLADHGVPAHRIVADGWGLDSYDTCRRARDVYGVRKAILVSQEYHLPRAVSLCRGLGIDADGVAARCDGCDGSTLAFSRVREVGAAWKAVLDRLRDRPAAVTSPRDDSLTAALRD